MPPQNRDSAGNVLYRLEVMEERVKTMHVFDKKDIEAFDKMVSFYRGVLAFGAFGKWLVILATGVSAIYVALHNLTGWSIK